MSAKKQQDSKDEAEGASLRLGSSAWIPGASLGLAVFVLYLSTLAPTVLYYTSETKDAPVLPVAAYVLGISHPTGYPTYTILTHLFTYLPVGDVAYRVNLASAVFGALAVAALYAVGLRLSGSIVAALIGAAAFGTNPLFWSQAVIAEVYTLHVLFLAAALLVLLVWREKREDGYLLLAAGVIGLSMTHNLTSGLLLPTAAAFVLLVEPRKILDWKIILKGAGIFLISLLPYAYLPIRARMDPPLKVRDPSDWEGFWNLVTGGEFKANMWAFGPGDLPRAPLAVPRPPHRRASLGFFGGRGRRSRVHAPARTGGVRPARPPLRRLPVLRCGIRHSRCRVLLHPDVRDPEPLGEHRLRCGLARGGAGGGEEGSEAPPGGRRRADLATNSPARACR